MGKREVYELNGYDSHLKIRYLCLKADEKSGDSILIQTPKGITMLIDAGIVKTGEQLDGLLTELNVEKIDYAIATHPHHDHIGGYHTLLKTKDIRKIYTTNIPHIKPPYKEFVKIMEEKKVDVEYLEDGDVLELEEDLKIEVLNPPKGTGPDTLPPDDRSVRLINNLSIVMKLTYKKRSFLFTADLYKDGELAVLERHGTKLKSDFSDAPHHGHNTSSTEEFMKQVNSDYTVISANVIQCEDTYEKYLQTDADVYLTAKNGSIAVVSDGEEIEIMCEKE